MKRFSSSSCGPSPVQCRLQQLLHVCYNIILLLQNDASLGQIMFVAAEQEISKLVYYCLKLVERISKLLGFYQRKEVY